MLKNKTKQTFILINVDNNNNEKTRKKKTQESWPIPFESV